MPDLEWRLLLLPLGLGIVLAALHDLFVTTLTVRGGGTLSGRFAQGVSRLVMVLGHGRFPLGAMYYNGMIVLIGIMLLWVGMLWAGWSLAFSAQADSVVRASNNVPAGTVDRVYFVGYTLFTLGLGDYRPAGGLWQILTVLVVASGLLAVTLIITYALQVVTAASTKRQVAATIGCLGHTPRDILCRAWDGKGFPALGNQLTSLISPLVQVSQQYLMFPVLPYFHGRQPQLSLGLAVAVLDETLLMLEQCTSREQSLPPAVLAPLRHAIGQLLDTLESAHIDPAAHAPPPPDAAQLSGIGMPVPQQGCLTARCQKEEKRRRLLLGFLQSEGWSWNDVHGGRPSA